MFVDSKSDAYYRRLSWSPDGQSLTCSGGVNASNPTVRQKKIYIQKKKTITPWLKTNIGCDSDSFEVEWNAWFSGMREEERRAGRVLFTMVLFVFVYVCRDIKWRRCVWHGTVHSSNIAIQPHVSTPWAQRHCFNHCCCWRWCCLEQPKDAYGLCAVGSKDCSVSIWTTAGQRKPHVWLLLTTPLTRHCCRCIDTDVADVQRLCVGHVVEQRRRRYSSCVFSRRSVIQ